jgi:hypothetical protein
MPQKASHAILGCAFCLVDSQYQLPGVKSLSETAGRIAFHSAHAHQPKKSLRIEPALASLRLKGFHKETDFVFVDVFFEGHEEIWLAQIAIVFRDFIFQDQVVAERVPRQFRNESMILVRVVAVVSENYIRRECAFQLFEG